MSEPFPVPALDVPRRLNRESLDAKIVVLGNSGVGKTSLLHRYVQDVFDPAHTTSTTGAFFVAKRLYVDGLKVRLQLWDTAGQERFRSMAPMYYRGANAALLLYDITKASSFSDLKNWLHELKKNRTGDLLVFIVGAKADLHKHREVSSDHVRLSLHTWFPPPKPPSPPPSPNPSSFIRPRFTSLTSLTSSHSVPFLSPRTRTQSHSQSPPSTPALGQVTVHRSDSCSAVAPSRGVRPNLVRRNTAASVPSTALPLVQDEKDEHKHEFRFPKRPPALRLNSHLGHQNGMEQQLMSSTSEIVEEDDEVDDFEWGVERGMQLFEVSAKDDQGVRELFDTLIRAIIERRDIIDRERELRERDSVYLPDSMSRPDWSAAADEEEARLASANRWQTCC